ncbi:MAG: hypothetical protein OXC91_09795 [Rhodobacteraceae bacterium]|nr:hypothetical protein [Paracoccaceae bacterium]
MKTANSMGRTVSVIRISSRILPTWASLPSGDPEFSIKYVMIARTIADPMNPTKKRVREDSGGIHPTEPRLTQFMDQYSTLCIQ